MTSFYIADGAIFFPCYSLTCQQFLIPLIWGLFLFVGCSDHTTIGCSLQLKVASNFDRILKFQTFSPYTCKCQTGGATSKTNIIKMRVLPESKESKWIDQIYGYEIKNGQMRVSPESPIEERLEFAGFYLLNMSWAASLTSAPLNIILKAPPSFY